MEYSIEQYNPLKEIEYSLERQLVQGFKGFIRALMGNKVSGKEKLSPPSPEKRNYFLEKYQQILNKGRSGDVQVVKIKKAHVNEADKNTVVYITFRLISEKGLQLFTAVAMATRENIPAINAVIPIYFNPDDLSLVVLL